jgi:hypothetical protein
MTYDRQVGRLMWKCQHNVDMSALYVSFFYKSNFVHWGKVPYVGQC